MMRRDVLPFALALVLTAANVAKPVVVDDTAYLLFARHLAEQPLDPYGFELFWYSVPEPAMTILLPPVLPYWLGLGIRLLGENAPLLKMWLLPFAWLLAISLRALLQRFARGTEDAGLVLLMISPAVLPTFNFMLDIPALALGLAALAIFLRACDSNQRHLAVTSGLLLALALQTKYTMLVMPAAIAWAGLLRRRPGLAAIALVFAVIVFVAWEAWLHERYGQSHFLYHLHDQQNAADDQSLLERKWALVPAFFGFLGCTAGMLGFWAARSVGWPRGIVNAWALLALVGVVFVVFFPFPDTILVPGSRPNREKLTLASLLWRSLGGSVAITTLAAIAILFFRRGPRLRTGRLWPRLFLLGWLGIEVAGYFALTPFPAGRRLLGTTVIVGILLARLVSRVRRARPERSPLRWTVPAAVVVGGLFALLEGYDASIEKTAMRCVREVARDRDYTGRVWFVGHWGVQYYGEREGLSPYLPGGPKVQEGEWLVLPEYPNAEGFYRPYTGGNPSWYRLDVPRDAEYVERLVFDDALSGMTVPNFYGGVEPIVGRSQPRMVLGVFRLKKAWGPP